MTKLRSTIVSALALFAILRANAGTFEVRDGKFLLNGKPFQIIAGEMHYARIPREEWRQRLHMARVMGLNTISTYIFWNYHEPEQGKFDFSNNNHNLREFVREAQQESLYVILRPGPYACAEWDFGGYPAWLLKDHNLVVRSKDVKFLAACERYITRLGEEIQPLLITNGGPVIMSQVENEYGSYGSDTVYESKIRDMMIKAGFSVPLFTADGPSQCKNAHLAGVLPAINGETNPEALRDTVNKYNGGHGPYFVPEFYPGWLDHWGEEHANVPAKDFIGQYDTLIRSGASVSLYMFHGGTNFGFMNGANYGGHYQPQPTSYDYDAPLDEAGRATEKYFAFAKVLTGRVPDKSEYTVPSTMALAPVNLTESASLFEILSKPIRSDSLLSMEDMGQSYGYILYHTTLNSPLPGTLTIKDLHDYGIIFVGGDKVASLDSRHKQKKVWIPAREPHQGIDILVENGGRVNYGREILDNRKGITKSVTLEGKELKGWDIYSLPLDDISSLNFSNPKRLKPPAFYSGTFKLETCDNTFLDLRAWGKGCVWVNGYNLGRYWSIGPQQTLFLPGDWLKKGENRIVVLELEKQPPKFIAGLSEPILNQLGVDSLAPPPPVRTHGTLQLDTTNVTLRGEFQPGDSLQTFWFPPRTGRYICLQSLSSERNDPFASIAELYALNPNGQVISREGWKIYYVDGEELEGEDGRAENVFDDDPETIWHSLWYKSKPVHPHEIAIDLGATTTVGGFKYLSRRGEAPGKIKAFRFYVSEKPFGIKK